MTDIPLTEPVRRHIRTVGGREPPVRLAVPRWRPLARHPRYPPPAPIPAKDGIIGESDPPVRVAVLRRIGYRRHGRGPILVQSPDSHQTTPRRTFRARFPRSAQRRVCTLRDLVWNGTKGAGSRMRAAALRGQSPAPSVHRPRPTSRRALGKRTNNLAVWTCEESVDSIRTAPTTPPRVPTRRAIR